MPTFGSLFAGVGGFDLGFEAAGMTCSWQVEIDPKCRSVLERQFPNAQRFNDVREVGAHNLSPVDLVCGGFPCQDVSVAGRRAGLAGARTGLFWEAARILGELKPSWIVLENVPGLLSSNSGRDMGTVLGALVDIGYGVAYRVLDAQFFGVPQRRRRVFIVGNLGADVGAAASVLFEPEGGYWDSEAGGEKRPSPTGDVAVGADGRGESGGGRARPLPEHI